MVSISLRSFRFRKTSFQIFFSSISSSKCSSSTWNTIINCPIKSLVRLSCRSFFDLIWILWNSLIIVFFWTVTPCLRLLKLPLVILDNNLSRWNGEFTLWSSKFFLHVFVFFFIIHLNEVLKLILRIIFVSSFFTLVYSLVKSSVVFDCIFNLFDLSFFLINKVFETRIFFDYHIIEIELLLFQFSYFSTFGYS